MDVNLRPSTLLKLMLLADLIIEAEMEVGLYNVKPEDTDEERERLRQGICS